MRIKLLITILIREVIRGKELYRRLRMKMTMKRKIVADSIYQQVRKMKIMMS